MTTLQLLRGASGFRWLVIGAGVATALVVLFPPHLGPGGAGQAGGSYQPATVGAPPPPSTGRPGAAPAAALPAVPARPSAPLPAVAPALQAVPPRLPSFHAVGGEAAAGPPLDDVAVPRAAHGAVLHAPSQPAPRWGEPLPPLENSKP